MLIEDHDWLAQFSTARRHLAELIHPGYMRAAHITIAACGLLDQRHFGEALLAAQLQRLRDAKLPAFTLQLAGLNSFSSAPYLAVADHNGSLAEIRQLLAGISSEDSPAELHRPHVTLGLYRDAWETTAVAAQLRAFALTNTPPLQVSELAFCTYRCAEFQGPIETLHRVALRQPAVVVTG